jgi:hypothetical protein
MPPINVVRQQIPVHTWHKCKKEGYLFLFLMQKYLKTVPVINGFSDIPLRRVLCFALKKV